MKFNFSDFKFQPLYLIILISLFGCKTYVQVFDTNCLSCQTDKGYYIYENDTLKIIYSFWSERGLMKFLIYNKLNKPIYVDWKKSSYIDNTIKLNYWIDEEISKTNAIYRSYYYNGPLMQPGYALSATVATEISSKQRVERITFIPPKSNYPRSQFYILPTSVFKLGSGSEVSVVPRNDNPKKSTKVYSKNYNQENTPLDFRNFLTFSFSEDFKDEFYIDNEFIVNKIQVMDRRHFEYYMRDDSIKFGKFYIHDENGNPIKFSNFKKEGSFYLYVPK